jgi:UDP-N-acetylmuramoyl-tripeptide--D-alanyl-D-alanine ligase
MARSNAFLKLCNAIFPLRDFLYLLQLEEYETMRYAHRAFRRYFKRGFEQRDTLKWTARMKVIAMLVCALMIGVIVAGAQYFSVPVLFAFIVMVFAITPDVVFIANVISKPLFWFAHQRLNAQGRSVRERAQNLRVIAIAGSYGKTTTKNFLYEMIRRHHKTQLIEGNINTTAGIAQWMLKTFDLSTEVLIVEMDAYHPGEIAESCKIVQPSMAILTSIGDQHLVRFGSQEKIIQGLQEVFAETVHDGLRVCSTEVAAILKEHGYDHAVRTVTTDVLVYQGETIDTAQLSDSVREDAAYAAAIAEAMHVPARFVDEAIRSFVVPDRRQKEKEVFGYEGIDDSYNISVATAHAGVIAAAELAKASNKKLVVLTAGIPELPRGISEQENAHYGAFLAEHADAVLVLKSEHFADVARGINSRIPVMSAANLGEAVPMLYAQCPTSEYVLLFQPELTDTSY